MFFERAKPSVTGSRMATMAVLFIQALKNAVITRECEDGPAGVPGEPVPQHAADVIDRTGFLQSAADDKQGGDGQRSLVFEDLGHFPGIHQTERDHEAEDGERDAHPEPPTRG